MAERLQYYLEKLSVQTSDIKTPIFNDIYLFKMLIINEAC